MIIETIESSRTEHRGKYVQMAVLKQNGKVTSIVFHHIGEQQRLKHMFSIKPIGGLDKVGINILEETIEMLQIAKTLLWNSGE